MSDHILKVPKGSSIGMTAELYEHLRENGRIELYGEITIPGHGTITGADE